MKQFLTIFFFFLAATIGGKLFAQNNPPPVCPDPPYSSPFCTGTCVRCDMDSGFDDQTFPQGFNPPPFTLDCGFGAPLEITDPRWYAFIAGTSFVEFNIKATTCQSGSGLDAAIVSTCPTSGPPIPSFSCAVLDPANPVISANGLTPGVIYFLVVDGTDNAGCKFHVSVTQGSANAPQLGPIGDIQGPTEVCPKAKATYTVPVVANATTYTWTAPPGSKINGGGNMVTLYAVVGQPTNANEVEIEFGTQAGSICVSASSQCDTPITSCITVTNVPLAITDLPDEVNCYETIPYVWPEEPNTVLFQPGTYTLTSTPYPSYLGCDSIVRQKVKILPYNYHFLPTKYLCEPECFVLDGVEYCQSGTYQHTLISSNGCDSILNFTIVRVPVHAAAQVTDTITCSKPSVLLTSDSSSTGNSIFYQWLNPSGALISEADAAVATSPGLYSLIVTNFGGGGVACKDTAQVLVIADTAVPMANAGPDMVLSCAQPQVQLQGTGSVGPQFTYLWIATLGGNIVSGGATLTPIVNAVGNYILRVTNISNGCTAVNVAKVTAQTLPPNVSAAGGTYDCEQTTVTLQVTTNAVSPTFAWTGPNGFTSSLQNPVVNAAGDYSVVVTDSITGCTNTAIAVVVSNTQPPGAMAAGDTLTCVVNSVTLSGSSPASNAIFAWTGPNGFTSSMQNPVAMEAGNYLLTVTGANGCTSTASATVLLNNTPPGASVAPSGNLNCNNANINLVASSGPPANILSHIWTKPDGSTVNTGSNPVLSVNQPGAYSVVITNTVNGCTSEANATVIQNPNVSAVASTTLTSCNGSNDGSASVTPGGGNGTYTYHWSTGANSATVNNLGSGTYTVTVTDGENCTATATATVNEPTAIAVNASATPQTANGAADGTATAAPTGGTPGYTYNWSNGGNTATITDLLPGSYMVTVTDNNNCTAVAVVNVSAYNCTAAATIQSVNVSCNGSSDGMATMVVTNGEMPFTFIWSTGDTTSSIDNLAPGSYSGTATDAANCPVDLLVMITQPSLLVANASSTNESGPGTNDGTATAGPNGGTAPYSYLWTTGDMTATITGLGADIYTVTVTDSHGCTAVQSVEVLAGNCGLSSDFLVENPACNGLSNGEATVLLTGGNGPFTYAWSSGGDEATETGLLAGVYMVSVTDAMGCEITDSVTLTDPALLTVSLDTVINTSCVNMPAGSATVSTGGGTGMVNITWSDGQTGPTAINLIAGDFIATATDENGCIATITATIDAVDVEPPVITANPVEVPLGPTGTVTLTPQNLGITVVDNCVVSSVTVEPTMFNCTQLGPHIIQVTATDDSGNTSTTTVEATIIDNLPPITECPPSVVRCFGDNVVQYNAPVATDNCLGNGGMWELTAGLPSGASFPVGVTTNTYTYTDAGGNPGSCSFEVTILSQLMASAVVIPDTNNMGVGSIDLTVTGGLSPYNYAWTKDGAPFANTEDLSGLSPGNYTVVVTDDFGCTVQSESFIIITGAHEPNWADGLFIQPNPTSGHVAVIFPDGLSNDVTLTVYDVTGRRVVQQIAVAPKQIDIDLSAFPSGVYPIILRIGNELIARRIVVSK